MNTFSCAPINVYLYFEHKTRLPMQSVRQLVVLSTSQKINKVQVSERNRDRVKYRHKLNKRKHTHTIETTDENEKFLRLNDDIKMCLLCCFFCFCNCNTKTNKKIFSRAATKKSQQKKKSPDQKQAPKKN